MTDEKLDQILKQALAPEIDDKDIQIRRKEKNNMSKRKIVISGLIACAALVLVVAGIYIGGASRSGSVAGTANDKTIAHRNIFAITAYAKELTNNEVNSGDVVGLSTIVGGWGSSDFLDQRFTISGQNIESIKVTTDKCEIYTMVPVYKDDPDFERAENAEAGERELFEPVFEGEPEEEHYVDHYEHLQIVGQQYEGAYNDKMYFGMSVPKELWSDVYDLKQSFWEDVDQVNGATVSISVKFTDGSTEEHQYKVNTGKIFVPQDENGVNQWDQLTRFLTADEEAVGTPFIYGYLMDKAD